MIRPTTNMQLAIIKKLEPGRASSELSSLKASGLMSGLINSSEYNNGIGKHSMINEDRLAMALRECFRYSANFGRDVWGLRRNEFIKDVIETYHLFTEITVNLKQDIIESSGDSCESI